MTNEKDKSGRPSSYTIEIGDDICDRLANGESLRAICADDGMPGRSTVFRWLGDNESFRDQYARAREDQAETMADDIVAIADGDAAEDTPVATARDRLRVDARKWVASKLKPKKYGDRTTLAGDPDAPLAQIPDDQLDARLAALMAKVGGNGS